MDIERYDPHRLAQAIPFPAADTNKYTRGKLTILGGAAEYPGSVCLAGAAAMRLGAGYVECLCAASTVPIVQQSLASLVVREWDPALLSSGGLSSQDDRHPQACLIGSGMYDDRSLQRWLVQEALKGCAAPLVLDGGALRVLADAQLSEMACKRAAAHRVSVLTPHGGEAAALARAVSIEAPGDETAIEAQAAFAQALANAYQAFVLLKGPVSFIAAPEQTQGAEPLVYLMDQGTPALAKAGTGDVLAGMVGALLCQGGDPLASCVLACTLHGEAARCAAAEVGVISVCAEDVISHLPAAIEVLKGC